MRKMIWMKFVHGVFILVTKDWEVTGYGYVRAGRQEARPVSRSKFQDSGAGSSREPTRSQGGQRRVVGDGRRGHSNGRQLLPASGEVGTYLEV
ncbi:hypothetical protein CJ030_MR5G018707 [Morella rubra]|uniref:Uncharacterized protein n=1 Tax=Morella rubra TaxID=262757 RepID=A0A6A1VQI9_9ROSI|nr:hypothetical protein CJ030_MR5G018707 [Morella rubra]